MSLVQTIAPDLEPVTLEELKLYLRVEGSQEDQLLMEMLQAAREGVEGFTGLQLLGSTWTVTMEEWPDDYVELQRSPLDSVTSVKYYPGDGGALETLDAANYEYDAGISPGRLYLADGASWPVVAARVDAIAVAFVAGFGEAVDVPGRAKIAIKLWASLMYEQRLPVSFTPGVKPSLVPGTLWNLMRALKTFSVKNR